MKDKICIVTGANSGIGLETARGLAAMGAHVVMVCRSQARGEAARQDIMESTGSDSVELFLCDLSSQQSIRRLAGQIEDRYPRIDVLINNAGLIFGHFQESVDGIEMTFALNHLGYFLLTNLLLDRLKAGAPARIINVSSNAHRMNALDFDDLQNRRRYSGVRAYNQSKLCNVLFTNELARRLEGTGVTANCLHPGMVNSNYGQTGRLWFRLLLKLVRPFMISAKKGADTPIYLASSPDVAGVSGKYLSKRRPCPTSRPAGDEAAAARLWALSEELTQLAQHQPGQGLSRAAAVG